MAFDGCLTTGTRLIILEVAETKIKTDLRVIRVLDSSPEEDEIVVDSDRVNRWWHEGSFLLLSPIK